MRWIFLVFIWGGLLGASLSGCGPDTEVLEVSMQIYDTEVSEVTTSEALFFWRTTVPGNTRVDLALLREDATNDVTLESVSDELYLPLWYGGGVRVDDPRFESVTDTRLRFGPLMSEHVLLAEDLLPGRTYVATVSSNSGLGAQAREFGINLTFTTLAAEVARAELASPLP